MKTSDNPPTKSGWYWFKPNHFDKRTTNTVLSETEHRWLIERIRNKNDGEWGMVQVVKGSVSFPGVTFKVEEMQGWWSERLKAPEEK